MKSTIGGVKLSTPTKLVEDRKGGRVEIDGYGRIPFENATFRQALEILEIDVKKAKCGDPFHCAAAEGIRRNWGKNVIEVVVFKTVAHVVFRKKDGTFCSMRYSIRGKLRKAIAFFDANRQPDGSGKWNLAPGVYYFDPPTEMDRAPRFDKPTSGKGKGVQRGEKVMQSYTRRLIARDRNAAEAIQA